MESEIEGGIRLIAFTVELCSASILLYGFIKVFLKFWLRESQSLTKNADLSRKIHELKPVIGSYILLGLDFYIISDILGSMVAEDQNSLIKLGGVVLLRTLIGYFLGKEVEAFNQPGKEVES
jgi:uncharacterized membrane protein